MEALCIHNGFLSSSHFDAFKTSLVSTVWYGQGKVEMVVGEGHA